jgi:hypothetical protein
VALNATNLTILIEIWWFFLDKCSLGCHKVLVSFLSSKMVDFAIFLQFFHCFYGRISFGVFFSSIYTDITLFDFYTVSDIKHCRHNLL